MPTERYGETQIREVTFTEKEILEILKENAYSRIDRPYDFDYKNAMILKDGNNVILRFVQEQARYDIEPRSLKLAPLKPTEKG